MDVAKPSGPDANAIPREGDVVAGKYVVERVIGEGGMGVVVVARHKQLGEQVAIKLLHPDAAMDGEAVARLLREAKATMSIKSEHVVRIKDVDTLPSGSPYILMEYLEGTDLGEYVRANGHLSVDDTVDYVLQASEAVAEAHARGVVHRDLKPSNLFLTRRLDGSSLVKVLDFGISKALVQEEQGPGAPAKVSLTATRAVFGSPLYMSPEQVRSAKRVDERTDIWALGIILHELLTGSLPFAGETLPGVLASIIADPPEPLHHRRPDAPAGLEEVIGRCLVKDVKQRFQTVAELATALEPFAPEGARISVQRIVRLAHPGSVSRRLPDRSSSASVHPASPSSATVGLESTVKAITTSSFGPPAPSKHSFTRTTILGVSLSLMLAMFAVVSRTRFTAGPPASSSYGTMPLPRTEASVSVPTVKVPMPTPGPDDRADAGIVEAPRPVARTAPHARVPLPAPSVPAPAVAPKPNATPPRLEPQADDALDGR